MRTTAIKTEITVLLLAASLMLSACGTAEALSVASCAVDTKTSEKKASDDYTEELYEKAKAAVNGETTDEEIRDESKAEGSENVLIDWSDSSRGIVAVKYLKDSEKTLRIQIKRADSEADYGYIISPHEWQSFPLSDREGKYKLSVYMNVSGSKYALVYSSEYDVKLESEQSPFLESNMYVNFSCAPVTIELAKLLADGKNDPFEIVDAVFDFTVSHLSYDKELAETVEGGYVPDLDKVLETRKGICFDYAALMTGMLRAAGVPSKLVAGYAGGVYHAWISVWSEEEGWIDGVIYFNGDGWQRMDPTFADSMKSEKSYSEYIGDGSHYTDKFYY